MQPAKPAGGLMLVAGPGSPSPSGGGDLPRPPKPHPDAIPIPKGFDTGGAQPGDTITVQMDCKISDDGRHLIPTSVDGSSTDGDDAPPPPPDGPAADDGSTPGSRWDSLFGKGGQ